MLKVQPCAATEPFRTSPYGQLASKGVPLAEGKVFRTLRANYNFVDRFSSNPRIVLQPIVSPSLGYMGSFPIAMQPVIARPAPWQRLLR